jgi:predicted  nucleic acid-binding Zn-ribbon protein
MNVTILKGNEEPKPSTSDHQHQTVDAEDDELRWTVATLKGETKKLQKNLDGALKEKEALSKQVESMAEKIQILEEDGADVENESGGKLFLLFSNCECLKESAHIFPWPIC